MVVKNEGDFEIYCQFLLAFLVIINGLTVQCRVDGSTHGWDKEVGRGAGKRGEIDQIGSFSSLRARHLFRVRHLSALCGTCCAQALVLAITIILSRYPEWLRIPIARPDFVTCYQTGPQAASYFEWQHEVLISCS